MTHEVYRLPLYYDIAFTWDVGPEIEFFGRLFEKYVPHPVKHVLEPACRHEPATGRRPAVPSGVLPPAAPDHSEWSRLWPWRVFRR